jgi:hypothetical protein
MTYWNHRELTTEQPWANNRRAWVQAIYDGNTTILDLLPEALPKMKVSYLNFIMEYGINRRQWAQRKQEICDKVKILIFDEYKRRDHRVPVVSQDQAELIITRGLKWDHFTNVSGIVNLYYKFKQLGFKDQADEAFNMIMNFKPGQVKKLLKTWPDFVQYAEEGKFHEKMDNIKILSVYYRNPELRKHLNKEYYELLKSGTFAEALTADKKRTYREIKFFDKEFGCE